MRLVESLGDEYIRRALVEILIIGTLCGVVGVQVVLRRLSFLTMALTHATFPGVVLASLVGLNLVLGAGLFGILLVLPVAALVGGRGGAPSAGRPAGDGRDVSNVTGVVLSAGFALGVGLMSAQDGSSRDLAAFLVGSILTVQETDLVVSAVTAVVVLTLLAALRKELTLGAFDPAALAASGYPVRLLDLVLLLAIEATVVTSLPAAGTILAVALVVGPAATARLWCARVGSMTAAAVGVGLVASVVGLAVSEQWNVAAGGAIVLAITGVFVLSLLLAPLVTRSGRGRGQGRERGRAQKPRREPRQPGDGLELGPVPATR